MTRARTVWRSPSWRLGFAATDESATRGRLRGIGIANAIESAGGPHRGPMEEAAEIRFDSGGSMTLLMGSHNHGQGHETVFRQIAQTRLGIPPGRRAACRSPATSPRAPCARRRAPQ